MLIAIFLCFKEHKKWAGYSERDAKVKYTQQCRALKTYGITFFLVKVCTLIIEDPRYNDSICYQRYCCKIEFAVIKKI